MPTAAATCASVYSPCTQSSSLRDPYDRDMLRDFPLIPGLLAHATTFAASSQVDVAEPRRASTVVLLRDGAGEGGLDVFVMRRTSSMAFAASMHVFPGGGVDPRDCDGDVPWGGPSLGEWARRLQVSESEASGLVCAAVRELFEECGVLLAGPEGEDVVRDLSDDSWEADRLALLDRSLALSELLERRGLELRTELLSAWSHWCTPVFEPRRYDTWFFVAALPEGPVARHVPGEADHSTWVNAAVAAAGGADGTFAMLPPTLVTLEEVSGEPDVAAVLRRERSPRLLMPWLLRRPDGLSVRIDLDGVGGGEPGPASGIEDAA
jgi:8-oxo-dGTP pyrophosphatase MutT (NUDIX family)